MHTCMSMCVQVRARILGGGLDYLSPHFLSLALNLPPLYVQLVPPHSFTLPIRELLACSGRSATSDREITREYATVRSYL